TRPTGSESGSVTTSSMVAGNGSDRRDASRASRRASPITRRSTPDGGSAQAFRTISGPIPQASPIVIAIGRADAGAREARSGDVADALGATEDIVPILRPQR